MILHAICTSFLKCFQGIKQRWPIFGRAKRAKETRKLTIANKKKDYIMKLEHKTYSENHSIYKFPIRFFSRNMMAIISSLGHSAYLWSDDFQRKECLGAYLFLKSQGSLICY